MKKLLIASLMILFSVSVFSDFNWKLMGETKNADKFEEHYLKKIQNSEKLNAFCLKSSDLAISKAEYCDKIMKSEKRGKLCGIPIAIKDIFCTKNQRTQAASKILQNFVPEY